MLTLRERALIKSVENLTTLQEVVNFCREESNARDLCDCSKAFWLFVLPRVGKVLLALCFEPLKDKYWGDLIRAIENSIYIKYHYEIPDGFDFDEDLKVELYKEFQYRGPLYYKPLYLPALNFVPGTEGWIVRSEVDNSVKDPLFALASKDGEDRERLIDIAFEIVSEQILEHLAHSDLNQTKDYLIIGDLETENIISVPLIEGVVSFYDLSQNQNGVKYLYGQPPDRKKLRDQIETLFRLQSPNYATLQLHLYGNPYIETNLKGYVDKVLYHEKIMISIEFLKSVMA